jgi:hypothetical protein
MQAGWATISATRAWRAVLRAAIHEAGKPMGNLAAEGNEYGLKRHCRMKPPLADTLDVVTWGECHE